MRECHTPPALRIHRIHVDPLSIPSFVTICQWSTLNVYSTSPPPAVLHCVFVCHTWYVYSGALPSTCMLIVIASDGKRHAFAQLEFHKN